MFKNFTLLLLLSISLPAHAADAETNKKEEAQMTSSPFKLLRNPQMLCPTDEDIQSYENVYGSMHPSIKRFYQKYGNCIKKDLDLLHVYGGGASDLGKATGLIQSLPTLSQYHAFAFDQGAGGYWVYNSAKSSLVFELYNTSKNALNEDLQISDLKTFLSHRFLGD